MYFEGGIYGFCCGIAGILIHYLVISFCIGKTVTYGDYLGSIQLVDQNRSPLQKKVTMVYNVFHIVEAIVAFCILRKENAKQLDNYEEIVGFACGFLGLLIVSGIALIFAPREETDEENEIAEACFRDMKISKRDKDFKYNYHMAFYCCRFTFDKNPEETRSYLEKAEKQIQKIGFICNYSKAEIELFKWLISELRKKVDSKGYIE